MTKTSKEVKVEEDLSEGEIAARERRVLDHFLTSKPEKHKPLGKKPKKSARKKAPAKKKLAAKS